jgi:nicotinate-nucleotide pyrophosphorylase (carboxylating)
MSHAEQPGLPDPAVIAEDVERAFAEDLGSGDATADLLPAQATATAVLTCRDRAVLCGRAWFDACFHRMGPDVAIAWRAADGEMVEAGAAICELSGRARALVSAERSALNFLQLLSATATVTSHFVAAVAGTGTRILDTRKTIPGLRRAQKYAVRCGGGSNHRMGLYDAILIKENHIIAAGGIEAAVRRARQVHADLPVEIEVETLAQLATALEAGVDRIMLDNFTREATVAAVTQAAGRTPLEVSGNVGLDSVAALASLGVDSISIGALTKHVHAVDLSLRLRLD